MALKEQDYVGKKYGIDRIDNALGYTLDNIVPCCRTCNFMKQTSNQKDFINKCKQISTHWMEKKYES